MNKVHFVDTCVMDNLLDVPGWNNDRTRIIEEYTRLSENGDTFVLPVANQFSLSTTQKSESSCVAIACVFVTMMSSIISNSMFLLCRYSVRSDVLSGVSSKLKSVNVGTLSEFGSESNVMSKSGGSGNAVSSVVSDSG